MSHYLTPKKAGLLYAEAAVALATVLKGDLAAIKDGKGFLVQTAYGPLRGRLYNGSDLSPRRVLPPWAFFQFRHPSLFVVNQESNRLNQHSGKWNWMFGTEIPSFEIADMARKISEMNPQGFILSESWG